jgi:LPXTG-motif cell wall-anchored protein
MRKTRLARAVAVVMTLALALVIAGIPSTALADVTGVTITPGAGESYTIPVGGTVTLTANTSGTPTGVVSYSWAQSSVSDVNLSSTTDPSTTVTGMIPGTATTITVTVDDEGASDPVSTSVVINVTAMTISNATLTMDGGSTQTLTVGNVSSGSNTAWSSSRDVVATVNPSTGLVTAVGAGQAVITATNTPTLGAVQTKTCTVTVNPVITITPATQNITTSSTSATIQLKVDYGGDLISTASTVAWSNSNTTAGSLSAPTTFTPSGTSLLCTATYLSNASGTNGTSTITATINGAGTYTSTKTATVNVYTSRYLTLEGPTALNNTSRYGTYTLTLREANGTIVDDDTSTAHWSWSSSYLKISSADLNDHRADMENGQAQIQLYARYNTPTAGTNLYAWINDDSGNRASITIHITGLSSLPQTGQDFTLVYVFGGLCGALLITAGVWYAIRKKRVNDA